MQQTLLGMVLLVLACSSANAALYSRAGGQAYYDDVLNITWVVDANLADTNAFGVTTGIAPDGRMSWTKAQEWIAAMNTAAYLGKSDWRLPTVTDTGTPGCDVAYTGTDCGWNVQTIIGSTVYSEMAHMYYETLDNLARYNTSGVVQPGWGLINVGPFLNLQPNFYWSGTEYAPNTNYAWDFYFYYGYQQHYEKSNVFYVWAVRDGDIAPDTDGDGMTDNVDNCTLIANPSQCDSDGDGYGNHCDADLNNNGATNAFDTPLYRAQLGQPSVAPTYNIADLNCSGAVNAFDTPIFRGLLGSPPGPSGLVP